MGKKTNALMVAGNHQTVTKDLIQKTSVLDAAVHQHSTMSGKKEWREKVGLKSVNWI